ncbi:hypothetical protein BD324DRAFT_639454 [Kockovaella imperatae]|uniref:Membrane-associated proteins in eicosanoid and glutathione metabolism n=1 Tax=Kockovaella imperatae TaxID=4999 RepID=A0A1Y1U911_9TREE|nr:hypothetical protein BD324DRAFT_639454 [Kockovaella imperatae]ORX33595.1 hypothetical protein BD324DRAFT_639454 [Kockovaella imperatae]
MSGTLSSFAIPAAFPLVGLSLVATATLTFWQGLLVSAARKEAGVHYPNLYATDAEAKADKKKLVYNCTQRAHANTLENVTTIVTLTIFLGLYHPKVAAASNFIWVVGRVLYTLGYKTGDPATRNKTGGPFGYIGLLTLFFGTIYTAGTKAYHLYV